MNKEQMEDTLLELIENNELTEFQLDYILKWLSGNGFVDWVDMELTGEELNVLTVALDHMREYLDDLKLEPMSEIFDLDSKYKAYETLRYKLIGNIEIDE
jgi:hypothetical protein